MIRIRDVIIKKNHNLKNSNNLDWEFDKSKRILTGKYKGIGYILYSTVIPGKEKEYIEPEGNFKLEISSFNKESFNHAIASLWLSFFLGGFGSRSRRGAGNIIIKNVYPNLNELGINIEFNPNLNELENIKDWMEKQLKNIKNLLNINYNNSNLNNPKYFSLYNSNIYILNKSYDTWKDAINDIGKIYQEYRNKNKKQVYKMAIFGMPVFHNGFKIRIVPYNSKNIRISDRMSSPLIIKINKIKDKYYVLLITYFNKNITVGKEIKKENKKYELENDPKNINVKEEIINFINYLENQNKINLFTIELSKIL